MLLVGLMGGIGMGAIAGARRTQSSFSTFLASTNPPDLTVTIHGANANSAASSQGDGSGFCSSRQIYAVPDPTVPVGSVNDYRPDAQSRVR